MYIKIVLGLVGFIGALTAIGGDTWKKEEIGIRKVTTRGWIALACLFLTLCLGIVEVIVSTQAETLLTDELKGLKELAKQSDNRLSDVSARLVASQDHESATSQQLIKN